MKIGFIGTGIMGRPMAGHLASAGHALLLLRHRSAPPEALIAAGATVCCTAAEVARQSDIVISMLPDTPDVAQVLFGADGVAEGLCAGKLVIDMSSIDPLATRDFAARIERQRCDYIDAPVSGGEVGATAASLTIMVGGSDAAVQRAWPLFALMGKNITHVGATGAGQIAKIANQIIVALNIEAVSEALVFASKAGVDPPKVREALNGGFASSRILDVHAARMLARTFAPGFRIALHRKDLALALDTARALGMTLPGTALTRQLFDTCVANGDGDSDHSAMIQAIERLADHSLG